MKILCITSQLPYPPHSGGVIKSYRLIGHLCKHAQVTLLCNLKGEDPSHEAAFLEQAELVDYASIHVERPRSAQGLLKSYLQSRTLNEWRNHSQEMEQLVAEKAEGQDAILVDHYEMWQFIPENIAIPVLLHTHNAEHIMWQRFAELTTQPLKRFFLAQESKRIQKAEAKACAEASMVFAAPADIEALKNSSPEAAHTPYRSTYHLGNDKFLELPTLQFDQAQKALLFFGSLGWHANTDGLDWFIREVWPLVSEQEPEAVFYIVGKEPPISLRKLAKNYERIVFTGFVDDLDTYFTKCRVFVNPVRFGSGIKVKMLDAMYRGMPTVSSVVGSESLNMNSGNHYLEANEPEDWKQAIHTLLNDATTWQKISTSARDLAHQQYRWAPLLEAHFNDIRECISQPKALMHAL